MVALVSPPPSMCHILLLVNPCSNKTEHSSVQQAIPKGFYLLLDRRRWLVDFAMETGQGFTIPHILALKKMEPSNQQTAGCSQHVVSCIIPCEATDTGAA